MGCARAATPHTGAARASYLYLSNLRRRAARFSKCFRCGRTFVRGALGAPPESKQFYVTCNQIESTTRWAGADDQGAGFANNMLLETYVKN